MRGHIEPQERSLQYTAVNAEPNVTSDLLPHLRIHRILGVIVGGMYSEVMLHLLRAFLPLISTLVQWTPNELTRVP
jgi:hypothetical protein